MRDVEELRLVRGVILTYEAGRSWCWTFGQAYVHQLRRQRPKPGDNRQLDQVLLPINGQRHDLWQAVDQDGHALDLLVQRRSDKLAAKKFIRK
jgi:putative transposase